MVIGETIGNPGLEVLDIPAVAAIAHAASVPLLVDSTFATPYLCRPLELGADLVMHSITKWIGGHGIAIGGAVIDGGRFDWDAAGMYPTLTEPVAGYQGIVFTEQFGPAAFMMRARTEGLAPIRRVPVADECVLSAAGRRDLGSAHAAARREHAVLLDFLQKSAAVAWVVHPGLPTHPDYELAKRLLPRGAGSMVVSASRAAGRPARSSSTRCAWRAISPMWAMPRRS